jgi:hypothetical protein
MSELLPDPLPSACPLPTPHPPVVEAFAPTVEFSIAIWSIREMAPPLNRPVPIPEPTEPEASTVDCSIVTFSILNVPLPSQGRIPIPIVPELKTDAFTKKSEPHVLSRPTPIPGPFPPPSANTEPPFFDETVRFDSAQSIAAAEEIESVFRTELNPSKTNEMELPLIKSGSEPSTSTSENRTKSSEFATETANSAERPTIATESELLSAAVPLQTVTLLLTTSNWLWLRSQVRVVTGASSLWESGGVEVK